MALQQEKKNGPTWTPPFISVGVPLKKNNNEARIPRPWPPPALQSGLALELGALRQREVSGVHDHRGVVRLSEVGLADPTAGSMIDSLGNLGGIRGSTRPGRVSFLLLCLFLFFFPVGPGPPPSLFLAGKTRLVGWC